MSKPSSLRERKLLREKIRRLNLNEDELLIKDNSENNGTLKRDVHPYVIELLASR